MIRENLINYHIKHLETDPDEWSEAQTDDVLQHIKGLTMALESPLDF